MIRLEPACIGAPGAGGLFRFADRDARLGYTYVMNKPDFYLENDPREKALRDAVYSAIARVRDSCAGRAYRDSSSASVIARPLQS